LSPHLALVSGSSLAISPQCSSSVLHCVALSCYTFCSLLFFFLFWFSLLPFCFINLFSFFSVPCTSLPVGHFTRVELRNCTFPPSYFSIYLSILLSFIFSSFPFLSYIILCLSVLHLLAAPLLPWSNTERYIPACMLLRTWQPFPI
jgi:hypothetical protein